MLLAGVALWSVGTLVAPPAAHAGLLALCASRVIVRATPLTLLHDHLQSAALRAVCANGYCTHTRHIRDTGHASDKYQPWFRWAPLLTLAHYHA